jgi:type IV secretory pathway VirB2 component (pilin)
VMTELMDENVGRPFVIGSDSCVEVENPAAAVGLAVDQDFDELIRCVRGGVAKRVIVGGEDVALAIESVIGRTQWRAAMHSGGRPRDA